MSMITVYLAIHNKNKFISLIPGMFYTFVVMSFILHAEIGFNLDKIVGRTDYLVSYIVAGIITVIYAYLTLSYAKKHGMTIEDRILK